MTENNEKPKVRLSVSKTKTYTGCHKNFEFVYVLKLPREEKDYHIFGSFCHKILEDFHNAYVGGSTNPHGVQMGIAYKSALLDFESKLTREQKLESRELMKNYIQILGGKTPNVLACEEKFEKNINDDRIMVTLNGFIDRIDLDDDGIYHCLDYKTSKSDKYLKDDWFQLLTYAYVYLMDHPEVQQIRGSYVMVRQNFERVTRTFDREEILTVAPKYLEYGYQMYHETEFKPNPTFLCNWCQHQNICPAGQTQKPVDTFIRQGELSW